MFTFYFISLPLLLLHRVVLIPAVSQPGRVVRLFQGHINKTQGNTICQGAADRTHDFHAGRRLFLRCVVGPVFTVMPQKNKSITVWAVKASVRILIQILIFRGGAPVIRPALENKQLCRQATVVFCRLIHYLLKTMKKNQQLKFLNFASPDVCCFLLRHLHCVNCHTAVQTGVLSHLLRAT